MLDVRDLSIELGEFALHDVSLHIPERDYFCLLGPTGAGKTILLECVCGLLHARTGTVRVAGEPMDGRPPEARQIGYVPQDYALFPHMTVADNIAYGLRERRVPRSDAAEKTAEMAGRLGIEHLLRRKPTTLSGGERQRVALARALVLECRLLLLDEPFGAVDQLTKHELFPLVSGIHERMGLTVIHVTHDFSEAHALADTVGVINRGRLLQVGSVDDVFSRPAGRTVAQFVGMRNVWSRSDAAAIACPLRRAATEALSGDDPAPFLCVAPGDILVEADAVPGADFTAPGRLTRARWLGAAYELEVDTGVPTIVTLSAREFDRLGRAVGDSVALGIGRENVHLMLHD